MLAYKELGFASYAGYLESREWKVIRARILKRDKKKCRACGEPTRIVHHRCYDLPTLKGERDCNLIALCDKCHDKCHWTKQKKRRNLAATEDILLGMLRKVEASEARDRVWEQQLKTDIKRRGKRKRISMGYGETRAPKGDKKPRPPRKRMNDKRRKSIIESITSKPRF